MAIGTEAVGDRGAPLPWAVEGPLCIVSLVGVGGTLPDITLGAFWLSFIAGGKRGMVMGCLPIDWACGTGGALWIDGASWSENC